MKKIVSTVAFLVLAACSGQQNTSATKSDSEGTSAISCTTLLDASNAHYLRMTIDGDNLVTQESSRNARFAPKKYKIRLLSAQEQIDPATANATSCTTLLDASNAHYLRMTIDGDNLVTQESSRNARFAPIKYKIRLAQSVTANFDFLKDKTLKDVLESADYQKTEMPEQYRVSKIDGQLSGRKTHFEVNTVAHIATSTKLTVFNSYRDEEDGGNSFGWIEDASGKVVAEVGDSDIMLVPQEVRNVGKR